jgi:GNAT superfamily N-acetyltransferase
VATRALTRDEIDLIWTIDRSEVHHHIFKVVDARLTLVPSYFEVPGWHPATIESDTVKLSDCFDRGGIFRGNFDGEALTGVSIVDTNRIESAPDHLQLLYLYVSRPVRGQGVGTKLFAEVAEAARGLRAKALYISAVPTENTVNFYLHLGASLVTEPDHELLAAEPDDAHLTYPLDDAGDLVALRGS